METFLAVAVGLGTLPPAGSGSSFRSSPSAWRGDRSSHSRPKFAWIGTPPALVVLGVATVLEIGATTFPGSIICST